MILYKVQAWTSRDEHTRPVLVDPLPINVGHPAMASWSITAYTDGDVHVQAIGTDIDAMRAGVDRITEAVRTGRNSDAFQALAELTGQEIPDGVG